MFVKLHNQILDSSIADNRKLRHFFIDLLLCSDQEGVVLMTKNAIASRIRAPVEEVEWGLGELQKPDPESRTPDNEGKRIAPLEGHGHGWKILNYQMYRGLKSAEQLRTATRERVKRWREAHPEKKTAKPKRTRAPKRESAAPGASGLTAAEMAVENAETPEERTRAIELLDGVPPGTYSKAPAENGPDVTSCPESATPSSPPADQPTSMPQSSETAIEISTGTTPFDV